MPLAFRPVLQFIGNAVFPWQCVGCGKAPSSAVCHGCAEKFAEPGGKCYTCYKPSPYGLTHPSCHTSQGLDGILAAFDYHEGNLRHLIVQGKYYFLPGVFESLGFSVAAWLRSKSLTQKFSNALIVPVPLASSRRSWRGFNQAETAAKIIAQDLNLPLSNKILTRTSYKATQKGLGKSERAQNIRGVFDLVSNKLPWYAFLFKDYKLDRPDLGGKTILLVDDVVTTGSTMREACKVLKRNGAKQVWGLAIASD